jgi:DNA-binding NtrC family response regulator
MASILCVDDEPAVLALLQDLLAPLGHDTIPAASVEEAIRVLGRHHVDLVLVDCIMPGRDGFAFLEHLHEHGLKIPAIMMTGYSSVENAVAAIRGGAAEYITKPLRAESVRLVITSVLQQVKQHNGQAAHAPSESDAALVPPSPQGEPEAPADAEKEASSGAVLNLRELQQIAIRKALQVTKGHKTRAAELLGINERTLRNKLKGDGR